MKGLIIAAKKKINKKNSKESYVRNDVMTIVIKRCRSEKNNRWIYSIYRKGIRAIDEFRKN